MKKICFVLSFLGIVICVILFLNSLFTTRNLSVKSSVTEISIVRGSQDKPIVKNTKDDIDNILNISNISTKEISDIIDNLVNYNYVNIDVEIENLGDVDITFKEFQNFTINNFWLLNQQDGRKTIAPNKTSKIHIIAITKRTNEIFNLSIPIVFEFPKSDILKQKKDTFVLRHEMVLDIRQGDNGNGQSGDG